MTERRDVLPREGQAVSTIGARSLGVEEELLLVDPATGEPRSVAAAALSSETSGSETSGSETSEGGTDGGVEGELMQQQLETGTRPVTDTDALLGELRRWRERADEHARQVDCRIAALSTSPVPAIPRTTRDERYHAIAEEYGITQAEQLACGMHVHVSTESDEEGVAVIDRIRPWLSVLIALSVNSPFWQGVDTGYASFRSQLWRRWPSAGSPGPFGSPAAYHAFLQEMVESGGVLDEGMLYFDVRLSQHYPTVELRVADVCPRVEVAATLAVLGRALVERAAADWRAGVAAPDVSPMTVSLMTFRAGRSGLGGDLIHPLTRRPARAAEVVGSLLDHVREPLDGYGDSAFVDDVVGSLLTDGTSADRQRRVAGDALDLPAVVRDVVSVTAGD